jgi:hypothetical protein
MLAGQQRSVSCVADTSTQKEVVVECFAPYDDHRCVTCFFSCEEIYRYLISTVLKNVCEWHSSQVN